MSVPARGVPSETNGSKMICEASLAAAIILTYQLFLRSVGTFFVLGKALIAFESRVEGSTCDTWYSQ